MSNSFWPHEQQHARLPCPSPTPGACPNSCPSRWWCHPTISSSVIPFSSYLQCFPGSGSFLMSQFFTSGGQSISLTCFKVLPMTIQDWFPLGLTVLIALKSKGFSRVFSNIIVQKHQFFSTQLSLWSKSHIHTSVQSLSHVWLFVTLWTEAHQTSLPITNSWSLPKLMCTESVMPSNHLILCHAPLLPPSVFPRIRVFSNESVLHIRWPKYWSFNFSISPSDKYSGLISFRIDWLDLLAGQRTLKNLLQHHSSKPSILWPSAFFMFQLSYPSGDFAGGPVAKTEFPVQGDWVQSLVRELDSTCHNWGRACMRQLKDPACLKEGWASKNWYFWTVMLEEILESPLDCKEIKAINPKGN